LPLTGCDRANHHQNVDTRSSGAVNSAGSCAQHRRAPGAQQGCFCMRARVACYNTSVLPSVSTAATAHRRHSRLAVPQACHSLAQAGRQVPLARGTAHRPTRRLQRYSMHTVPALREAGGRRETVPGGRQTPSCAAPVVVAAGLPAARQRCGRISCGAQWEDNHLWRGGGRNEVTEHQPFKAGQCGGEWAPAGSLTPKALTNPRRALAGGRAYVEGSPETACHRRHGCDPFE
jgi:hypothetical protein